MKSTWFLFVIELDSPYDESTFIHILQKFLFWVKKCFPFKLFYFNSKNLRYFLLLNSISVQRH